MHMVRASRLVLSVHRGRAWRERRSSVVVEALVPPTQDPLEDSPRDPQGIPKGKPQGHVTGNHGGDPQGGTQGISQGHPCVPGVTPVENLHSLFSCVKTLA